MPGNRDLNADRCDLAPPSAVVVPDMSPPSCAHVVRCVLKLHEVDWCTERCVLYIDPQRGLISPARGVRAGSELRVHTRGRRTPAPSQEPAAVEQPVVKMTPQGPWKPLRRVAVSGSTHGNEMSGVILAKHWLKDPSELFRSTFRAEPFIGNLRAMEKSVRFIDQDLNRSFKMEYLLAPDSEDEPYEVKRAKEINKLYGPKGSREAYDFMFDMHNTTANMGACFIVDNPQNTFVMHLVHYVQTNYSVTKKPIYIYKLEGDEAYTIDSICKNGMGKSFNGMALEVGPQPQGVVRADCLTQMRALVTHGLDFIDQFNQGIVFPPFETEAFRRFSQMDYPRHPDGQMSAIVHAKLQDNDFEPVNPGDPIFQTLDGKDVLYEGDSTIYPAFINEAAYYEKKVAFNLMEKVVVSVPALQVQMD